MNRARLITTAAMLSGLLGLAGPALAETAPCTLNGVEPLPVLEAAKAAFLKGKYHEFYRLATPYVPDARSQYPALMGRLAELFPNGFPRCSTVLQRRDVGGAVFLHITQPQLGRWLRLTTLGAPELVSARASARRNALDRRLTCGSAGSTALARPHSGQASPARLAS